jgi:hypothetical protein
MSTTARLLAATTRPGNLLGCGGKAFAVAATFATLPWIVTEAT